MRALRKFTKKQLHKRKGQRWQDAMPGGIAGTPYPQEQQTQPDTRHGAETRERVRTARRRAAFLTLCRVGVFVAAGLLCVAFWAAVVWLCCIFFPD